MSKTAERPGTPPRWWRARDSQFRPAAGDREQHDLSFHAGKRCAQTIVRSGSERKRWPFVACDVKTAGVIETQPVTVCSGKQNDDRRVRGYRHPGDLRILSRHARYKQGRRLVAQELVDCARRLSCVAHNRGIHFRVLKQCVQPIREQVARGAVPSRI